jgi:hypothetical protein
MRLDAVGSFQELTMPPSGPFSASSWIGAIANKASESSYCMQHLSMRGSLRRSLKGIP